MIILLLSMVAMAGTGTGSSAPTPAPAVTTASPAQASPVVDTLDQLKVELQTNAQGKRFIVATPKAGSKVKPQRIAVPMKKSEVFSTEAHVTCETAKKEKAYAILFGPSLKTENPLKAAKAWVADEKTQHLRPATPEDNVTCK